MIAWKVMDAPPEGESSTSRPETDWSDRRLVNACLRGDERAWHGLVDRYKNLVYSIVLAYVPESDDADVLFQTIWAEILQELPALRGRNPVRSELMHLARRVCRSWWQKRASRNDALLAACASSLPDEAELFERLEQEQIVREAIARLPLRCRELVQALFFDSPRQPYAVVARRLGIDAEALPILRSGCLDRLGKILAASLRAEGREGLTGSRTR